MCTLYDTAADRTTGRSAGRISCLIDTQFVQQTTVPCISIRSAIITNIYICTITGRRDRPGLIRRNIGDKTLGLITIANDCTSIADMNPAGRHIVGKFPQSVVFGLIRIIGMLIVGIRTNHVVCECRQRRCHRIQRSTYVLLRGGLCRINRRHTH